MDAPTVPNPCAWVSLLSSEFCWRYCLILYVHIDFYVSMSWFCTNGERFEIRILLNRSGAMRRCAWCHRPKLALQSNVASLLYVHLSHSQFWCWTLKHSEEVYGDAYGFLRVLQCPNHRLCAWFKSMAMPRTPSTCFNVQNTFTCYI